MSLCRHCFVSGRVQGVWFRASTREQALRFGVTGFARNLPDGRVEVMACGTAEAVEALESWLWQGPEFAEVRGIECQSAQIGDFDSFSIG